MKEILLSTLLLLTLSGPVLAQGEQTEPVQGEDTSADLFRWLNFAILFGGLGYLLRKPTKQFFETRRREISEGLNQARTARDEAQKRMDEIERRLAALSTEMLSLRKQAEKESAEEHQRIIEDARREVDRIVERSRQEIERIARGVERDIKEHLADQVIDRASRTLQTQMTEDDHRRVVVRFIRNL
jgi:F-type H+-transporting ATPase subunit b